MKIVKVIESAYDGWYVVKYDNNKVVAYEGIGLCPKQVQAMIGKSQYTVIQAFHNDIIFSI